MTDITANVVVSMPSQLFTMARSFKAVANGKIYIGKIDTDPVNPENQIQVYVENEDGSHVPVSQPIIINAAGYPVYNGQIAKFVTVQGHSMAVYDAYGAQQFYFPNVLKYDPDQLRPEFEQFKADLAGSEGAKKVGMGERTVYDNLDDIKHSGNYVDLQEAIDITRYRDDLLITPGTYTGEYTSGNANLIGTGYNVIFKPDIGKTSITLSESSRLWQYRHAQNFLIEGNISTPQGIGIAFGSSNLDGRWNFRDIAFDGLDIGVYKPKGNIGNTYKHCSYLECNYGHKAQSENNMHAGSDSWRNCHFAGIKKYCIYINGKIGGPAPGGGIDGIKIQDCIMEQCEGGGIYLNGNDLAPVVPPVISNVWFELVAKDETVDIDGVVQKPRQLKLVDMPSVVAEQCYFNNIELINSTLIARGCRFDSATGIYDIQIDDTSKIIARDVVCDGYIGPSIHVDSIAIQHFGALQNVDISLRGTSIKGRVKRLPTGEILNSESFTGDGPWQFLGTGTVDGSSVSDGSLSDKCAQVNIPAGYTISLNISPANIAKFYHVVWGCSIKLVSGDVTGSFSGDTDQLGNIYTSTGEWVHTFGVGRAVKSGAVKLTLKTTSGCVVRLNDYFVCQFIKSQDAYDFANSRMSIE
ncbi:TPA: phage head-binding domain-containing protein [Escherichia coli]